MIPKLSQQYADIFAAQNHVVNLRHFQNIAEVNSNVGLRLIIFTQAIPKTTIIGGTDDMSPPIFQ